MAADLNPSDQYSSPARFVDLDGTALFWANYGSLYRSDGTEAGTVLLRSGIQTAQANGGVPTTVAGNSAYFVAAETSGASMYLWRTDGTAAGTEKIVQMPSNAPGTSQTWPLASCNGTLYFGDDGQLWKSDGSAAGTMLVHSFSTGAVPSGMTFYNGEVYFSADGELWKTDGTDTGTQQVKDINTSGDSSPAGLTVANGLLYFSASTPTAGREPWRTDGSTNGTILLRDIAGGNTSSWPEGFVGLSAGTAFIAQGYLYITDGTTTNRLYGAFGDAGYSFTDLVRAGNYAFASAYDSVNGNHLWRTDGTHNGTIPLESFNGDDSWPLDLIANGSELFFTALGTGTGRDVYRSDGTTAGTVLVKDLPTTGIGPLTSVGNNLFFSAIDPIVGSEPFVTDGTGAGTHLLKNLNTAPNSSNPGDAISFGGDYYVSAMNSWWRVDANSATLIPTTSSEVPTGYNQIPPYGTTWQGAGYYFGNATEGLYRLDTNSVTPLSTAVRAVSSPRFTAFNGKLYLIGEDANTPYIYMTDGTAAGTGKLNSTLAFTINSQLVGLGATSNWLYFTGTPWVSGGQPTIYRSDGTAAGTTAVLSWQPTVSGAAGGFANFTVFNGLIYFTWSDSVNGSKVARLYSYDGASTPSVVAEFNGTDAQFSRPFIVGDKMYFTAGAGSSTGTELYVTDGTAAGTHLVRDIYTGTSSSNPVCIASIGTRLFFTAADSSAGRELWVTDGSNAGTIRVTDIKSGPTDSFSAGAWTDETFAVVDGQFFFRADDGVLGNELWKSDGTAAGTVLVADINPGLAKSDPASMAGVGSQLFFAATDPTAGREVWMVADEFPPVAWPGEFSVDANRLTIPFNENVDPSEIDSALVVENVTTSATIARADRPISYDSDAMTANFKFPNGASGLPEGNYRATLAAGNIADSSGNTSAAAYSFDFYVLPADGNRNRTVDLLDFNILAANFGKSGQTFSEGNYNYSADGVVSLTDFNILAANFGKHLDPPAGSAAPVASLSRGGSIGARNITATRWSLSDQPTDEEDLLVQSGLI